MISIQSYILTSHPYFNEPGNELDVSEFSLEQSNKYNNCIKIHMMKSAMIDLLNDQELYPQFKSVIINHFKLKKQYILEMCKKWIELTSDVETKNKFNDCYTKLIHLFDKLN